MVILVLDHHPIISEMILMLIRRVNSQARVLTARTFKQLNALIDKIEEVNVVIMEPQSIGCSGSLSVALIAQRLPNAQIIVITDAEKNPTNKPYLGSGAHRVIFKKDKVSRIYASLQETLNPLACEEQTVSDPVQILTISKRHLQLINLLAKGCTNQQIAELLNLSEHTIKVHFYRLYKKLGVKNRLQALHFARTNGLLLDDPGN